MAGPSWPRCQARQAAATLHGATAPPGSLQDLAGFKHAHAWRQWLFSVLSQTFGVLHATKHYRALSLQESHRHSCDLRPNSIYLGRLLYVSKLQELTAVKAGVGCMLAGEGAGSGAAEIIPSTPSGLPTAQQQAKHCLFRRKTQDYFFSTSSAESPMARCACERFKRNVLRL